MTKKTAVLIPSRNEAYLSQTVASCFDNARDNLEVVVTLEGYWPSDWKELTAKYPNLHTVHHGEPRGLRAAVNSAAASAISRGADYLFKLDAHCMLDEGFDVKLLADIDDDWIVVPRRKRLDAVNWTIQDVGKPDIDYHYLSFPDDPQDFGGKGLNGKVWDQRIRERLGKPEYDVDDEMASQGSAWFMSVGNFQRLELMDEANYGPFWNESQELFNKNWLSGGRCVVNKKTWYAHLHKSRTYHGADGKGGRGYTLPESWLQRGATFTKNWIYNEAWSKQTLPFEWLIDHFWPVPTWPDNWREVLYAERKPRVLLGTWLDSDSRTATASVQGSAEWVRPADPDENDPVTQVVVNRENGVLLIHKAHYGIGGLEDVDVRQRVEQLITNNCLDIIINNSTLTPGQNPFRGQRKQLNMIYSFSGGDQVTAKRFEKDWLIIGQPQQRDTVPEKRCPYCERMIPCREGVFSTHAKSVETELREVNPVACKGSGKQLSPVVTVIESERSGEVMQTRRSDPPLSATALNDYLIHKFSISPQRLRAPMPIELRDFHRNDLAKLFAELGFSVGCEVGVAEAIFSEVILQANPSCRLLLVDPWHSYSSNPQNKSKERHEFAYNETLRRTKPYPNVKIDMRYSMDAVRDVADGSLDFFYCDANHLFDHCVSDLIWWSKKLRSGGLATGDDYYSLDQRRWTGGGVVEAVQAYVNAHRIPVWYVFQGHKSVDFMWVKP